MKASSEPAFLISGFSLFLEGCRVRIPEFEPQRYFYYHIFFLEGGGLGMVNLLLLGTTDMTTEYIVILF